MSSAVKADSLEAALETAIRRFDGTSPVTAQVHASFGFTGVPAASQDRSRMRLVLEVVAEEGGAFSDGIDVACAVEILRGSTLVHDTVEDAERSRFGLAHGINAGDALCALAYLQLLEQPARRLADITVSMTRALHEANFALRAGQAQELAFASQREISNEAYLQMLAGKAALFAAACELGAFAGGASCERAAAYGRMARSYAMAFQMEDHVKVAPADRHWLLPPVASPETARASIAEADAAAKAAGIDVSGRVRAFFTDTIRKAA